MAAVKARLTIVQLTPEHKLMSERVFRPNDPPFSVDLELHWLNDGAVRTAVDPRTLFGSGFYYSNQPPSVDDYVIPHIDQEGKHVAYPYLDREGSDPTPGVRVRYHLFGAKTIDLLDISEHIPRRVSVEAVLEMAFREDFEWPATNPEPAKMTQFKKAA